MASTLPSATSTGGRSSTWAIWLCWLAVALDGFDLVVLGAVIPVLSKTGDLGFTDASLTTASTLGLVGVGIGAVLVGPITDRIGRRVTLLTSIAFFSLLTLAIPLAANTTQFTALRFAAGLGLGACLPTALTLMSEHVPASRNSRTMTLVMTGYHAGAVLTALLALWLIDERGWESLFVVGGVLGLLVLPLMWAKLPESETFLAARAADADEEGGERVSPRDVVAGRYLRISIGLWVASFMGLLLVYGLNTWLPKIMEGAGYSIQAGTTLLLVLNAGAVAGLLVAGRISDQRGNKPTAVLWFAIATVALAMLSIKLEAEAAVYVAVFVAGVFVFSSQVLVYSFVSRLYPPQVRGTALGMSAGVGRVGAIVGPSLGGALVTAGLAYPWGFYAFAAAAALAVVALSFVPAEAPDTVSS